MAQEKDVFDRLRHQLITAGFAHGAKLRAEHLRDELGCSASTVREALFRLSTVGLVTFQEQRGFRVPERSPKLLHELTHLRVLLEAEGTALSIENGGVAWEARLSAVHHQLSHIETRIHAAADTGPLVDIWFNAEKEFHDTLISACESDTLKATHAQVYDRFRQQLMVEDRKFDFVSVNIQHHAEILDAALAGDKALTRQKIHDHLARHLHGASLLESA